MIPKVEATVTGLKQGIDKLIPLTFTPISGVVLCAPGDAARLRVFQVSGLPRALPEFRFELSTSAGTIVVKPDVIELLLARTLTLALTPGPSGVIALYGTLFVEDPQGRSRLVSGVDLSLPVERSFL